MMAKAQVIEVVIDEDRQPCSIEVACTEVEEAVKDRRENGGAQSVVRTKALSLIEQLFADLET